MYLRYIIKLCKGNIVALIICKRVLYEYCTSGVFNYVRWVRNGKYLSMHEWKDTNTYTFYCEDICLRFGLNPHGQHELSEVTFVSDVHGHCEIDYYDGYICAVNFVRSRKQHVKWAEVTVIDQKNDRKLTGWSKVALINRGFGTARNIIIKRNDPDITVYHDNIEKSPQTCIDIAKSRYRQSL